MKPGVSGKTVPVPARTSHAMPEARNGTAEAEPAVLDATACPREPDGPWPRNFQLRACMPISA